MYLSLGTPFWSTVKAFSSTCTSFAFGHHSHESFPSGLRNATALPCTFPTSRTPRSFPPSSSRTHRYFEPSVIFRFTSANVFILIAFLLLHINSAFPVAPSQAVRRERITAVQMVGKPFSEHQLRRSVLLAPFPPTSPTGRSRFRHPPFRRFRHTPFPTDKHRFIFPL